VPQGAYGLLYKSVLYFPLRCSFSIVILDSIFVIRQSNWHCYYWYWKTYIVHGEYKYCYWFRTILVLQFKIKLLLYTTDIYTVFIWTRKVRSTRVKFYSSNPVLIAFTRVEPGSIHMQWSTLLVIIKLKLTSTSIKFNRNPL